jgi:hypothetical protein
MSEVGLGCGITIFLLAYRASVHNSMGLTPANLVFGRDLRKPSDLLFGTPPDKEDPQLITQQV